MGKKKLIKNTSYLAITRIVQFVAGLIRVKINALIIGATGIGVFNQLSMVTHQMNEIATLSMNAALVKQIAENRNNNNFIQLISSALKTYILLITVMITVSLVLLLVFSQSLAILVFGDTKYLLFLLIGIFSFPFLVANSIPYAILQGFKGVKYIAFARMIIIIANLVVFAPLVFIFGLTGAVIFFPVSFTITLIINLYFAQKYYIKPNEITIKDIARSEFKPEQFKEFITFAGFGLTTGVVVILSELFCRSIVIEQLGIDQLGMYSPNVTWGTLFTGFMLPALNTYLYPRFCEIKSNLEINEIINDVLRISTFFLSPLIFLGIAFRYVLIPIFYSTEFIIAAKFLPFHFIGIIFYVWWYVFMLVFTPTGRVKLHGIFMIFYSLLSILVVYLLVPEIGLWGWMLKFVVSPVLFFFIYGRYLMRKIFFKITKENFFLMFFLLFCAALITVINVFVEKQIWSMILALSCLFSMLLFLNREEHNALKTIYKRTIQNFRARLNI